MRGVQKGEENAHRLRTYLDALGKQSRGLPARDGKPNLSAIADACGFDRGVFYTNQMAKILLDEATSALGLAIDRPESCTAYADAVIQNERKAKIDKNAKALEEELLQLRAENAQLRKENGQLRAIRRLVAETGRIP